MAPQARWAKISLDDLLARLVADCEVLRARHPYRSGCRARFIDLDPPVRPPDLPAVALRLVRGGKG